MATNAGNFCGSAGTAQCTTDDVVIINAARRDIYISVSYKLMVYSENAATLVAIVLTSYMDSPTFVSDLQVSGGGVPAHHSVDCECHFEDVV